MEAYYMCPDAEMTDQRAENRRTPNAPVSFEELRDLGILHWSMDPATMLEPSSDGGPSAVDKLCQQQGYKNRDEVRCSPDHLPAYEDKLKAFFTEHIHEDEEIRLIKDGVGYFDVRSRGDEWIRIKVTPGDLIVLPAGIYHRFTMDTSNWTHAVRLFKEVPKWTPINRPCDANELRQAYAAEFLADGAPRRNTIAGPAHFRAEDIVRDLTSSSADALSARFRSDATQQQGSNIYVHYPENFDSVVRLLVKKVLAPGDAIAIYVTGTHNPTTHQSWCPDCVAADPILANALVEARAKAATAAKPHAVHLIQCAVERSAYRNNPNYFFRKHPFTAIRCIPTLIVATAKAAGAAGAGGDVELVGDQEPGLDVVWKEDDKLTAGWVERVAAGW